MDPDATLAEARDALKRADDYEVGGLIGDAQRLDALGDLAEAFENLDDWLSKGGFLPLAWQNFGGQKQ